MTVPPETDMALPGNIPDNVFRHHMNMHFENKLPRIVHRYWSFSFETDPFTDSIFVRGQYKRWRINHIIERTDDSLSMGLLEAAHSFAKHFQFLYDCKDEEHMYALLLMAEKPKRKVQP